MIESTGVIGARYSNPYHSEGSSHTERPSATIGQPLTPTSNVDPVFTPFNRTQVKSVSVEAVHH